MDEQNNPNNNFAYSRFDLEQLERSMADISGNQTQANSALSYWITEDYADGNCAIKIKSNNETNEMNSNNFKLNVEYTNKSSAYGHSRTMKAYRVGDDRSSVFRVDQIPFPECCGITILKNIGVSDRISRIEFKEVIGLVIDHLMDEDQYSKIIIYTTDNSTLAKQLARFDGALMTGSFRNRRSGNILVGFEIDINPSDMNINEDEHDDEFDLEELDEEDIDQDDLHEEEVEQENARSIFDLMSAKDKDFL